ncbi:hypothetical protein CR513_30123, partial [Mucuna pruriens]
MREEVKTLERNSTWGIVDKPKYENCKLQVDIHCERDWLQKDTHTLMTLTIRRHFPMAKMNAKNKYKCFPAWRPRREVYMETLPGFESQGIKNKMCKLKKTLYGLKQSPMELKYCSNPKIS